ncbi:MAG: hypothetical protein J7K72_05280 [Candidatus Aenigmarchaeota archaeon]|nr:hypothetical protein [Candidatus Aenigmarchaeota archaeon]
MPYIITNPKRYRGAIILDHDGVIVKNRSTTLLAENYDADPNVFLERMIEEYRGLDIKGYLSSFLEKRNLKKLENLGQLGAFITDLRHVYVKDEEKFGRKDTVRWKNAILQGLEIGKLVDIMKNKAKRTPGLKEAVEEAKENEYIITIFSNSIQPVIDVSVKMNNIDYGKANGVWIEEPEGMKRPYIPLLDLESYECKLTGEVIKIKNNKLIKEFLEKNNIGLNNVIVVDDTTKDEIGLEIMKEGGIYLGFCPPGGLYSQEYAEEFRRKNIPVITEDNLGIVGEVTKNRQIIEHLR